MSSQTDLEIITIIHMLSSPFNDKYNLTFLSEIRRKLQDYKALDTINYEFMVEKFESIDCPVSNEMRVRIAQGVNLRNHKIEFIKKIRAWFNDSEKLYCSLSDAKNLVERIIK
jgi:hypothetical protein